MAFAHETETRAGLPEAAALTYIRNAAIELARRSRAWRKDIWIDAQKGVEDYPIGDGCDVLLTTLFVEIDGVRAYPAPGKACNCGFGRTFAIIDGMLRVYWTPQEDQRDAIHVRAAFTPSASACEIDEDFFANRYRQVVIDGALAAILLLPGQPFTNVAVARAKQQDFERGCGEARRDAALGQTGGPMFARPAPFVSCRRFR
jgi:hypothetical protein